MYEEHDDCIQLTRGECALIISKKGCSVRYPATEEGGLIPPQLVVAVTLATLLENDPYFREYIRDCANRIRDGTWVPIDPPRRKDLH